MSARDKHYVRKCAEGRPAHNEWKRFREEVSQEVKR
jgi:hypothetical protein